MIPALLRIAPGTTSGPGLLSCGRTAVRLSTLPFPMHNTLLRHPIAWCAC